MNNSVPEDNDFSDDETSIVSQVNDASVPEENSPVTYIHEMRTADGDITFNITRSHRELVKEDEVLKKESDVCTAKSLTKRITFIGHILPTKVIRIVTYFAVLNFFLKSS
ncbi:hypothetical protein ACJMK2_014206 [Sinanodonta woodiana]|uniref:Uncharacterized protein n=1 Tax=Sinanodonta woodiana TaxID=1069815 RepID=A0ABD3UZX5_SINWO